MRPFCTACAAQVRTFRLPRRTYPLALGLTADLGQTVVSNRSLAKLEAEDLDLILLSGDLAYADGWPFRSGRKGRFECTSTLECVSQITCVCRERRASTLFFESPHTLLRGALVGHTCLPGARPAEMMNLN